MNMAPAAKRNVAVSLWAVGGVGLTFVEAIYRLGARALDTIAAGLTSLEWLALGVSTLLLGYVEGYRALQRRFTPRVVARAYELEQTPHLAWKLLGPFYVLSLLGDERRTVIRAWRAVALIVAAVFAVRALPNPWRGIVDAGVAVALTWGLGALVVQYVTLRPRA